MAEITNPELETKISIIELKCQINRINFDKEVIDYIASNIYGNIRQIERDFLHDKYAYEPIP